MKIVAHRMNRILQSSVYKRVPNIKAHLEYKAQQSFTKFPISACAYTELYSTHSVSLMRSRGVE